MAQPRKRKKINRRKALRNRSLLLLLLAAVVYFSVNACRSSGGDSSGKKKSGNALRQRLAPNDTIRRALKEYLDTHTHPGRLSFAFYDLTADTMLLAHNEDSLMPSASCQKLLTFVAAMKNLGAGSRFCSHLYTCGSRRQDTLVGDIVMQTGFDPLLRADELVTFTRVLQREGIRHVKGRIVLAMSRTDYPEPEQHWKPWDLVRHKYGLLYQGRERVMRAWKGVVRAAGVRAENRQFVYGRVPRGAKELAYISHPMSESLYYMMQNSSNVNAESMLYPLGHRRNFRAASYREEGIESLRSFVRDSLGRRDSCHAIEDGCGLCYRNRLTASLLVDIMRYVHRRPALYKEMLRGLPVAGVSGTLRREMVRSKARGRLQGKTGTLTNPYGVSTLTGYLTARDGRRYAFSIMCSETPVADARQLQERLCSRFF